MFRVGPEAVRRRSLTLAAVAATLLAAPALAQTTNTKHMEVEDQEIENLCPPTDTVIWDGFVHSNMHTREQTKGRLRINALDHFQGQGFGVSQPERKYSVNGQAHVNMVVTFPPRGPIITRDRTKLVNEGTEPPANMYITNTSKIVFDANGTPTAEKEFSEINCRG